MKLLGSVFSWGLVVPTEQSSCAHSTQRVFSGDGGWEVAVWLAPGGEQDVALPSHVKHARKPSPLHLWHFLPQQIARISTVDEQEAVGFSSFMGGDCTHWSGHVPTQQEEFGR